MTAVSGSERVSSRQRVDAQRAESLRPEQARATQAVPAAAGGAQTAVQSERHPANAHTQLATRTAAAGHEAMHARRVRSPASTAGAANDGGDELARGAKGPEVKELQKQLNERGAKLAVDGDFGPLTEKAVKAHQGANGLDASGVVDDETVASLSSPPHGAPGAGAAAPEGGAAAPAPGSAPPAGQSAAPPAAGAAPVTNSAGPLTPAAQKAADAVYAAVPGIDSIGGTRASARDPDGHPSGKALDLMVGNDKATGDAAADFLKQNWDKLGVEYVIWQQQILTSPNGSWQPMEDRGSPTQNHMDHVHVNVA